MDAIFISLSRAGREKPNEDTVFAGTVSGKHLMAVADGMGGKPGGGIASKLAIETLIAEVEKSKVFNIDELLLEIRSNLKHEEQHGFEGMGTTLTFCLIEETKCSFFHIGDTRLYLLRENGLKTLTRDQTEVQRLIDEGVLSKARAKRYRRKNILYSVLTSDETYSLESGEATLKAGDRLILSTDGFYEIVSKQEIRDASVNSPSLEQLSNTLEEVVKAKEIKDDYSFAICEIR